MENNSNIDISVIIPTYNRKQLLREVILSLFQQSYTKDRYEIIVVDNSSTDGTDQLILELQKNAPCKIIYYKKDNKGPAAAQNLGIKKAKGGIIAFTDSDCLAHVDWLRNGIRHFTSDDIAFVSGRVFPKPNQTVSFFSPFQELTEEHPFYPTLNIFYRRDILTSFGGFEEGHFSTDRERAVPGHDTIFAWRVKRQGLRNYFAEDVIIYHEIHRLKLLDLVLKKPIQGGHLPLLFKKVPELRSKVLYCKFLISPKRAFFFLMIFGVAFGFILNWLFLVLVLPYAFNFFSILDKSNFNNPMQVARAVGKLLLLIIIELNSTLALLYYGIKYRSIVL